MTKIGIVGNRKNWTYNGIKHYLDELGITQEDIIVSGGALGVDQMAERYAKEKGCTMVIFNPKIKKYGIPNAYFERNKQIAKFSDKVIGFNEDGKVSGTSHTLNESRCKGKEVYEITNVE